MSRRPQRRSLPHIARIVRRTLRDALRGYRRRRRRRDDQLPTDADTRRAELARMGTTVGARMTGARIRTIGASREKRKAVYEQATMKSAAEVLEVMGNMKGAVMKLAQMASFAIDGLPSGVEQQLSQLQSAAPPMSFDLVEQVVTSELGAPPAEVFGEFSHEPIAAASIGQVHRARTRDGRDVVVKVQYPGVDEAIKADLANADMLFSTMAAMYGGFDPRALLQEVVERMTDEFDYRREAANQTYFADAYRDHTHVKIPDVVPEHSAARVLTSELIEGRRFYDVLEDREADRLRYGEIVFRFAFSSVFRDGVFSGDPHPGNYIFMPDGRICFLDFGLVKRLSDEERAAIRAVAEAQLRDDTEALLAAVTGLGIIPSGSHVDPQRVRALFRAINFSVVDDGVFRFTRKAVGDAFRTVALPDSPFADLQQTLEFPAMLAIFQRYLFGTGAVLGHLEAEGNWHRILREIVFDAEPTTDIGRTWNP